LTVYIDVIPPFTTEHWGQARRMELQNTTEAPLPYWLIMNQEAEAILCYPDHPPINGSIYIKHD